MSHSLKAQTITFTNYHACRQVLFEKNLMNRFRENFMSVEFWAQKRPIYPILTYYQFTLKIQCGQF